MKHLANIARSATPSSGVLFRSEPYGTAGARDFLRDVLALANADIEGTRFIVVGADFDQRGQKQMKQVDGDDFSGNPSYPALASEFIEPALRLKYCPVVVDGLRLGVYEISDCQDRPYMMRIDHSESLRRGDAYQRINNASVKLGRRQLQAMFEEKFEESVSETSIEIGFPGEIIHKDYRVAICDLESMPSAVAGSKLRQLIDLKNGANKPATAKGSTSLLARLTHARLFGADNPYEKRSADELQTELQQVEEQYRDQDNYFLFEQSAEQLQMVIYNQGEEIIREASLAIAIPNHSDFFVAKSLPKIPRNDHYVDRLAGEIAGYPVVTLADSATKVRASLGDITPGEFKNAFEIPLRICAGSDLEGKRFGLQYSLFAQNLRTPVRGKLRLVF